MDLQKNNIYDAILEIPIYENDIDGLEISNDSLSVVEDNSLPLIEIKEYNNDLNKSFIS